MRNFNLLLILCLGAVGCMALPVDNSMQPVTTTTPVSDSSTMAWKFISVAQIHQGMTRGEAKALLGDKVVVGYELADPVNGQYKPLTMANPYRSEVYQKDGRDYLIEYYLSGIKTADSKVSDEELTPLVFRNEQLVGMGWDFLKQKIKP